MPTETITETVTVDREALIDAIAAIFAAGDMAHSASKPSLPGEVLSDQMYVLAEALRVRLLGPSDEDHEDALTVEIDARSQELEADLIDAVMQERIRHRETLARLQQESGRSAQLREYARRIRDEGSSEAKFPDEREMWELAHAEARSGDAS